MNHETKLMCAALPAAEICRALMDWLASKFDCLASAASMLVGNISQKRAVDVNEVDPSGFLPEDLEVDLDALNRLLAMPSTPDLDSMEAVCIVAVHPGDTGTDSEHILAASQIREVT